MSQHVAVIGAGIAGLACAQVLSRAGLSVAVYEKNRGLGGRCATRHIDDLAFDHGAQYVTAQSPAFAAYLSDAGEEGHAARWGAAETVKGDGRARHVGVPGMSGIAAGLAAGLDVRVRTEVTSLLRTAKGWALGLANGDAEGAYSHVVLAVPAPQARALMPEHGLLPALDDVVFAPCWAAMAAFTGRVDAPDVIEDAGPIVWAARDETKPGRTATADCWVLHAGSRWSREHLEDAPDDIAASLAETFAGMVKGPLPERSHLSAHRWRHARVVRPLGQEFLWDADLSLGLCGDWCIGPRVEAAFTSGTALGRSIVSAA